MTNLWKNSHYDANCDFIFDKKIVEYDMSKANISVLASCDIISGEEYTELCAQNRMVRQYTIGCMIRDNPKIGDIIANGIMEARKALAERFELEDFNVLHVNNDALFIVIPQYKKAPPEVKITDYIKFTSRGQYSSYYRIDPARNINLYYGKDITGNEIYKVRGIGEHALSLHKNYFLRILLIIARIQMDQGVKEAYEFTKSQAMILNSEIADYRNFRRFDSNSLFDIKPVSIFSSFQADYITDDNKDMIDKTFNLNIIYRLGSMFLSSLLSVTS